MASLVSSAARAGDIAKLNRLNPSPARCRDASCLCIAATNGRVAVLDWLAARGCATPADCREDFCSALWSAAEGGHVAVLDWLEARGCATPDDCRVVNCLALRLAAKRNHVAVLSWLEARGCATPADCRAENCHALRLAISNDSDGALDWLEARGCTTAADILASNVLQHVGTHRWEWLADRLAFRDFTAHNLAAFWGDRLLQKILIATLAGRRRKPRLPPELWEVVAESARSLV